MVAIIALAIQGGGIRKEEMFGKDWDLINYLFIFLRFFFFFFAFAESSLWL